MKKSTAIIPHTYVTANFNLHGKNSIVYRIPYHKFVDRNILYRVLYHRVVDLNCIVKVFHSLE